MDSKINRVGKNLTTPVYQEKKVSQKRKSAHLNELDKSQNEESYLQGKKRLSPHEAMLKALGSREVKELDLAMKVGANINEAPSGAKDYPIFYALLDGGQSHFFKRVMTLNPDLSVKSYSAFHFTPLESAVMNSDPDAVRSFLQKGSSITPSLEKDGALYSIASSGDDEGKLPQNKASVLDLLNEALEDKK